MKIKNPNLKLILAAGLGYATLYGLSRYTSDSKKDIIRPLGNITKEAELFDISPRDSTLSIQESEKFVKELLDRDKNGVLSKEEIQGIKEIIGNFKKESDENYQETAKNMLSGLEFVLIRQSVSQPIENIENGLRTKQERVKELNYSDFYRLAFQEKKPLLKKVVLQNSSDTLIAIFVDNSKNEVKIPADLNSLKDLADKLVDKSIEVEIKEKEQVGFIGSLIFLLAPIGLLILFLALTGRGNVGFLSKLTGLGKISIRKQNDSRTTFKDVAGIDEVKAELQEIVDFLKNPKKYEAMGARAPKGILLVGPPGTGKTLCAKAVAGEAKVPFFSLSGSDFVEMFVGVGAARARDLFREAKKNAPSVIFIDELDAVGRQRGAGIGGGHDEREQTLNQILVEMDGFDTKEGIIVIAATNRPDILDSALLRPGRFDRQVVLDSPDVRGREEILKVHSKNKPFATDVNLKILAQRTPGFTGADLANLLNEAALLAGRKDKSEISMLDIEEAIDKVIAGPEKKNKIISPKDKKLTAYHELGHALVAFYEKDSDPLHKVTIIPRGMALGLTMTLPEEDHLNYSKSQLLSRIKVMLGGRVAEEIVFGDITTGAQNDLKRATELLKEMITQFGMSEKQGLLTFQQRSENTFLGKEFGQARNYSEETAKQIDEEMKSTMDKLHREVKELLMSKRKHMDSLSEILLEKETLDAAEFKRVIEEVER